MPSRRIWLILLIALFSVTFGGASLVHPAVAQTVATVNIVNAKIVSSQGGQVTVGFDITNRTGVQPQVKYGIVISSVGKQSQVVDEVVSANAIDLTPNDSVHEQMVYAAPAFLSGSYEVTVEAEDAQGLPLGFEPAGMVTLKGASQYLEIIPSLCYLTVTQDTTPTHYTVLQGVDVLSSENLIAHCSVVNTFATDVTATPTFATYNRSVFGSLAATSTLTAITIPAGKTLVETFAVLTTGTAQAYDTVLSLADAAGGSSNTIIIHYVLHGESATIQNVVFDKTSYQSGDTANLSFFWSGSADNFPGSRLSGTTIGTTTVSIKVEDKTGAACASSFTKALSADETVVNAAIPITATCNGPQAIVSLANAAGTVLAANTFATTATTTPTAPATANGTPTATTSTASSGAWSWPVITIVVLIVLIIIGGAIWFAAKKKTAAVIQKVVVILIAAAAGVGFLTLHTAQADTVIGRVDIYHEQDHYYNVVYTFNLDNSTYPEGGTILATAAASTATCNNGDLLGVVEDMSATVNGETKNLYNNYVAGGDFANNSTTFTAPMTPGSYDALFNASSTYSDLVHSYGGVFSAQIPTYTFPYDVTTDGSPSNPQAQQQPQQGSVPLAAPDNCSFYSKPASIVIPQTSNLYYSCNNVISCNIQGGGNIYYPAINPAPLFNASGTQPVQVSSSTIYTLSCNGGGDFSNYVVDLQTNVNVSAPNVFEITP